MIRIQLGGARLGDKEEVILTAQTYIFDKEPAMPIFFRLLLPNEEG